MNPGDRKLCKTILWVFFIIEAIAIAGYIVLYFFLPKWVPINEFF
jgi:phage shock protein PspC (stress-responsive transcriptional regulator)